MRITLLKAGFWTILMVSGACLVAPSPVFAELPVTEEVKVTGPDQEPEKLEFFMVCEPDEDAKKAKDDDAVSALPVDIRADALSEAAISLGARAGLARRTFEIRKELDTRQRYLDKVFNFDQLLVAAPSGFLIEPPVVSEAMNAMLIDIGGQTAAVSDKIFNIIRNARIVSAAKTWRTYLEREWGEVMRPPQLLMPQSDEECEAWLESVAKGWEYGFQQADDIFKDDLARLTSDFEGMVRYRMLLAQGMISPPYALQVDRGVTGGGDEMRVGDRAVQITGVPQLITGTDQWKPASR